MFHTYSFVSCPHLTPSPTLCTGLCPKLYGGMEVDPSFVLPVYCCPEFIYWIPHGSAFREYLIFTNVTATPIFAQTSQCWNGCRIRPKSRIAGHKGVSTLHFARIARPTLKMGYKHMPPPPSRVAASRDTLSPPPILPLTLGFTF